MLGLAVLTVWCVRFRIGGRQGFAVVGCIIVLISCCRERLRTLSSCLSIRSCAVIGVEMLVGVSFSAVACSISLMRLCLCRRSVVCVNHRALVVLSIAITACTVAFVSCAFWFWAKCALICFTRFRLCSRIICTSELKFIALRIFQMPLFALCRAVRTIYPP